MDYYRYVLVKKGEFMAFYRVLLADDEEEIREGILCRVDWNALGFEVVALAENGMDALEMLEKETPDVIMTDIRMPFLDGLELIEKVMEICPTIKIILFSGFDDFEYAQKAIRLSVEAYMLKPMATAQIEENLMNLKKKMDAEREERQNVEELKLNYLKSLPVMKEQFLIGWVEGRIQEEDILRKAKQYQIELQKTWRTVVLLKLSKSLAKNSDREDASGASGELQLIAIKKTADSFLGRFHHIHSFIYLDYIVVITELAWDSQITMLINEANEVCKAGKNFTGRIVTAGIGGIYKNPDAVRVSYREAYNALEYSTLLAKEGAYTIYIKDIDPDHTIKLIPNQGNEQMLLRAIKLEDRNGIEEKIDMFFSELEGSCLPFYQYQIHILKILASVLEIASTYQLNSSELFMEEMDISDVLKMHSLEEIKKWMTHICYHISENIQQEQMDSRKHIVKKAKDLVEGFYSDDTLSAEKICKELHVSTAYFSTVFKKEEKMNFISYLTEVRLKHAVRLLETTSDKTYLIAAKVGYAEPNYFSYVFKKKYGVPPTKFRRGLDGDN